jgi:hypothetical protein
MSAWPAWWAGEFAQRLQVQRPDRALTTPVHDIVKTQRRQHDPRLVATTLMSGQSRGNVVGLRKSEGAVRAGGDANLLLRPSGQRLVEPDALDVGDVF